jgi:Mn2+/Fe2+ NRAMP family transporter
MRLSYDRSFGGGKTEHVSGLAVWRAAPMIKGCPSASSARTRPRGQAFPACFWPCRLPLAAGYLGLPKIAAFALAAAVIVGAAFTGSFRRFERIAVAFCAGSLLLIPVYFLSHPATSQMARDFVSPQLPGGAGQLSTVMLLIIGIVGTTVAPWQLFFQQSYVIDKRITPRFIRYEKADLRIGIVVVVVGAAALMGATAAAFAHARGLGHFTDTAGIARGLQAHAGRAAGVVFAVALLDASIIGAFAVSLSTAYAVSDVFGVNHSLHRGVKGAKGFYGIYAGLIGVAATVVLLPCSPLGLLTEGVQVLAGVPLPSASVFLLLLCNDKDVLGPWVNGRKTSMFTAAVVAILVTLSVILTASVLFPAITAGQILGIVAACGAASLAAAGYAAVRLRAAAPAPMRAEHAGRDTWRMPALNLLQRPSMSASRKVGMSALRLYLAVAMILVIIKIVQLAMGH